MKGVVAWFTGLPASGKTTLARGVQKRLRLDGVPCCLLDSDEVRNSVFPELGHSNDDRDRFYAQLAGLAALLAKQGLAVLVAATAQRQAYRDNARRAAPSFLEIHVRTPLQECERRDPKGLYERARRGELPGFPGIGAPYDVPKNPDLRVAGEAESNEVDEIAEEILRRTAGA